MSIILKGGSSSDLANVDAGKNLAVTLPGDSGYAGFAKILDSKGNDISTTENGAVDVSVDSMMFFEQVDGAAVNSNVWSQSTSGMAIAQASGFITLNSGAATTANAYAILSSIKNIPLYGHLPVRISINCKIAVVPQSNLTIEWGIGSVSGNSAPTDGVFFRMTPAGQLLAILNSAGVEVASSTVTPATVNDVDIYDIVIVEDLAQFYIGDTLVATVQVPIAQAYPTSSGRLPVFVRCYNSASVPSAPPQISIGQVVVVQEAMNQQRPWSEVLATLGRGAYQSPITPFAQTANHANSTNPASATLSNTAAGYTTLGGRFQFAMVAGAVTDFALFAAQVPAGYQFFVTGVRIAALNTGAANGATATVLDWSLGLNASSVSLATADGAGTWAPRRIPLGLQSLLALAGIGQGANDLIAQFTPALIVDSGRYLHVILQVPLGAATSSQVIRGDVMISGYFE